MSLCYQSSQTQLLWKTKHFQYYGDRESSSWEHPFLYPSARLLADYFIFQFALSLGKALPYIFSQFNLLRDLSEISRRGGGVETEGGSQLFEIAEKGGVMKNGPLKGEGSCKYVSVIMYPQKKKEVRNRRVKWSAVRIGVGLLMLSSKIYVYGITKNRLEIYFELS